MNLGAPADHIHGGGERGAITALAARIPRNTDVGEPISRATDDRDVHAFDHPTRSAPKPAPEAGERRERFVDIGRPGADDNAGMSRWDARDPHEIVAAAAVVHREEGPVVVGSRGVVLDHPHRSTPYRHW